MRNDRALNDTPIKETEPREVISEELLNSAECDNHLDDGIEGELWSEVVYRFQRTAWDGGCC